MKSRLPQGFGGSGNNSVNSMIKQAQKMQTEMSKIQDELNNEEFTGTSGGGAISVIALGNKTIKAIKINPDVVDKDDTEMLEDLIVAAINQVLQTIETESTTRINNVTGGLSIPGLE